MSEKVKPFTVQSYVDYLNEGKLMGSKCKSCGHVMLPPKSVCEKCFENKMEWIEVEGKGKLATFSAIHVGSSFMNAKGFSMKEPYLFGTVDLDAGMSIGTQIKGFDAKDPWKIKIGSRLKVNFEDGVEIFIDRRGNESERPKKFLTFIPE